MDSSKKAEPPIFTAIRLARMRDGNLGQAEEISSLIEILRGSEILLKIVNDVVMSQITKKPGMSMNNKTLLFQESFTTLTTALHRFVDAKIQRISKFIDYFRILKQDVSEYVEELSDFENDWGQISEELRNFKIDSVVNDNVNDSIKQANYFKNNILEISLPILERLTNIENKMQRQTIGMIAFIAAENSSVKSNDFYRLLTADP